MRMLTFISDILGGLNAATGTLAAVADQDFAELTWTFWLAPRTALLLAPITSSICSGSAS